METAKFEYDLDCHSKRMQESLLFQWHQGAFCDLNLQTKDGCIQVHACLLAAFSPKIAITLNGSWSALTAKESEGVKCLNINFKYSTVKTIVDALYSGFFTAAIENIDELLTALQWLEIAELLEVVSSVKAKAEKENFLVIAQDRKPPISDSCQIEKRKSKRLAKQAKTNTLNKLNAAHFGTNNESLYESVVSELPSVLSHNDNFKRSLSEELRPRHANSVKENSINGEVSDDLNHPEDISLNLEIYDENDNSEHNDHAVDTFSNRSDTDAVSHPCDKDKVLQVSLERLSFENAGRKSQRNRRKRKSKQEERDTVTHARPSKAAKKVPSKALMVSGVDKAGKKILASVLTAQNVVPNVSEGEEKQEIQETEPFASIEQDTALEEFSDIAELKLEGLEEAAIAFLKGETDSIRCHKCKASFVDVERYNKHVQNHPTFTCPKCNEVHYSSALLTRHIRGEHLKPIHLKCRQCSFTTKDDKEFRRHSTEIHKDLVPFKCLFNGCDYKTTRYRLLSTHFERHDFFSETCDIHIDVVNSDPQSDSHGSTLTPEKTSPSSESDLQISSDKTTMREEIPEAEEYDSQDLEEEEQAFLKGETNSIKCSTCKVPFTDFNEYKRHVRNHPTFPCDRCHEVLYSRTALLRHIKRSHIKPMLLKCRQCTFHTKNIKDFEHHCVRIHQNPKPFKCIFKGCNYETTKYLPLNEHLQMHDDLLEDHNGHPSIFQTVEVYHSSGNSLQIPSDKTFVLVTVLEEPSETEDGGLESQKDEEQAFLQEVTDFFKCSKCKISFTDLDEYKRHHVENHQTFTCDKCPMGFYSYSLLIRHIRKEHLKPMHLKCRQCSFTAKDDKDFLLHCDQIHQDLVPFKCLFKGCNYQTRKYRLLTSHFERHENRKYACEKCQIIFSSQYRLNHHKESCHNAKKFLCHLCGKSFIHKRSYQCHQETWHSNKRKLLKRHRASKRLRKKDEISLLSQLPETDKFELAFLNGEADSIKCRKCKLSFMDVDEYKMHAESHPTFACGKCCKVHYSISSLKQHVRNDHLKPKHLMCRQCNFTTKYDKLFRIHCIDIHQNVLPFRCLFKGCSYKTTKYILLNVHFEMHNILEDTLDVQNDERNCDRQPVSHPSVPDTETGPSVRERNPQVSSDITSLTETNDHRLDSQEEAEQAFLKGEAESVKCSKCKSSFTNFDEYKRHIQNHSQFICNKCNEACCSNSLLIKHILMKHLRPLHLMCKQCSFTTKDDKEFAQHCKETHQACMPFKCLIKECTFTTTQYQCLHRHFQRHDVLSEEWEIRDCEGSSDHPSDSHPNTLDTGKASHTNGKGLQYPQDKISFPEIGESDLECLGEEEHPNHIQKEIEIPPSKANTVSITDNDEDSGRLVKNQPSFTCKKCSGNFHSGDSLARHIREEHLKPMHLQCMQCGFTTKDEKEFQRHCYEIHQYHIPFKCLFNGCDYQTTRYRLLSSHFETHNYILDWDVQTDDGKTGQDFDLNCDVQIQDDDGKSDHQSDPHPNILDTEETSHPGEPDPQDPSDRTSLPETEGDGPVLKKSERAFPKGKKCFMKCCKCKASFTDVDEYNRHIQNHPTFTCVKCSRIFFSSTLLTRHTRMEHLKPMHLRCRQCSFTTRNDKEFKLHCSEIHEDLLPFKCLFHGCDYHTARYRLLSQHFKKHDFDLNCDVQNDDGKSDHQPDPHPSILDTEKASHPSEQDLQNPSDRIYVPETEEFDSKDLKEAEQAFLKGETYSIKCSTCKVSFTDFNKYKIHVRNHPTFPCERCHVVLYSRTALTRHIKRSHLKPMLLMCRQCNFHVKNDTEFEQHCIHIHKDSKPFKCLLKGCDYATAKYKLLNEHFEKHEALFDVYSSILDTGIASHSNEKNQQVLPDKINQINLPENVTNSREDTEMAFINEETYSFKCTKCRVSFTDSHEYKRHHAQNHQTFACDKCPTVCQSFSLLTRHIRRVHLKPLHLHCRQCTFTGKDDKDFHNHCVEVHQDHMPFKCLFSGCDYKTHRYRLLTSHFERHENRKYPCEKCQRIFSTSTRLCSHRFLCYNVQSFLCDLCGQSFNLKQSMKIHRATVHFGHRPHKCKVCSKSFSNGANLRRHMRIHTKSFPYSCSVCSKQFRHSNMLKLHMSRHDEAIETTPVVPHTDSDLDALFPPNESNPHLANLSPVSDSTTQLCSIPSLTSSLPSSTPESAKPIIESAISETQTMTVTTDSTSGILAFDLVISEPNNILIQLDDKNSVA